MKYGAFSSEEADLLTEKCPRIEFEVIDLLVH
jgi:hypothetical protein